MSAPGRPKGENRSAQHEDTTVTARRASARVKTAASEHSFKIKIGNTGATISCVAGQTVLQAAVAAGIDYPFACASGNCGVCISQLDAGEVSMLPRSDATLSPEQVAAGKTLACRARPCSDVEITWLGRGRR